MQGKKLHLVMKLFPAQIKAQEPPVSSFPPLIRRGDPASSVCAAASSHCEVFVEAPLDLGSKKQQISHDLIHQVSAPFFSPSDKCLRGGGSAFQSHQMNFTPEKEVGDAGRGTSFHSHLEKRPSQLQGPCC